MENINKLEQHERSKIKELLCGVSSQLDEICLALPVGKLKSAICSISWILSLLCGAIPD